MGGLPGCERAARALASLASDSRELAVAMVAEGALRPLIALLHHDSAICAADSAYALHNITSEIPPLDIDQCAAVFMEADAFCLLVTLLHEGSPYCQEDVACVLWNLLSNCSECYIQALAQEGCLDPLVYLLCKGAPSCREPAARALAYLAEGSAERVAVIAEAGALAPL